MLFVNRENDTLIHTIKSVENAILTTELIESNINLRSFKIAARKDEIMKDLELLFSHTFESHNKRINSQPKTFFSKNDTISSSFTGKDWGERNQKLENRKTRIKL